MSSGFQTAKKTLDLSATDLSAFNEPVSASKYLGLGTHAVTVADAEIKDYGYGENLIVTWESAAGESIRQFVSMFFTDKVTKVRSVSKAYIILTRALAGTPETRSQFFLSMVAKDTSIVSALKGLKATITVAPGKKGVDIVSEPISGGFQVIDIATKEKALEHIYMSMGEASQAAKDVGLKRAFPEIASVRATDEEVEQNEQSLRAIIETAEAPATSATLLRSNML